MNEQQKTVSSQGEKRDTSPPIKGEKKQSKADSEFKPDVFTALAGKSTDLDWFMFENKVRQIISDLVEPMQDKTNTFIARSENVLTDLELLGRRVDEVEFTMSKVQR